jgi:hypothetical protein
MGHSFCLECRSATQHSLGSFGSVENALTLLSNSLEAHSLIWIRDRKCLSPLIFGRGELKCMRRPGSLLQGNGRNGARLCGNAGSRGHRAIIKSK